jgi:hypothetical protein
MNIRDLFMAGSLPRQNICRKVHKYIKTRDRKKPTVGDRESNSLSPTIPRYLQFGFEHVFFFFYDYVKFSEKTTFSILDNYAKDTV